MVELMVYVQKEYENTEEYIEVSDIANKLLKDLNKDEVENRINLANKPGNKSALVQTEF